MPDPNPGPVPPATEDQGLPTPPSPGRMPPPKLPPEPEEADRPEPPPRPETDGKRPV
ncbi:hypothetical protein [Methylobacterium dankookense]|uniref:Uncharacterized protein n=1 Tax=Methylobacterium dankookense TaxID=560405 RepID=A0A564G3T4_9HYPH|nr:hypothetical protein [Methylobacterium dankookense]GJD55296.1 hypothetical protein IFDJLNFL_1180 [Methylobacterium dankookense]VUF15145.1 hypothetical protein MTDSW087_04880 [Methylobacterium dankookense]